VNIYILSAFAAYFGLLLLIGLIFHKKQKTSTDFIIGNRSLNFWVVALSAHASDMSAWLFMAFPATIFTLGLPQAWMALGLVAGMFANWHFVAPRLRVQTEQYDCITLPSFFEKRFREHSGFLRVISALMMIIFFTFYLSAGFIAMGYLFESLFGIDYMVGLTLAVFVIVGYTFIGGYTTVAWVDLFQGIFLLAMILLVPVIAYAKVGGWPAITAAAIQKQIPLSPFPDYTPQGIIALLSITLGWGLGYFGMPHIITKFMGLKDVSEMNKSKWLGMSWQVVALGAAAFIGLIGIAYFPQGLDKPQMVFVEMVKDLFHPLGAGFILCGILAANLSTMDSQILVCGSVLSEDLYKHFAKEKASQKTLLLISRLGVVLVSGIALVLAFDKNATILDTVLYSWSGLGSAFGPLVLVSLYSNRVNKYGAIAGVVVGGVTVMVWPYLNPLITNYTVLQMIPGFFCSLIAIYVVSALTKNMEPPVDLKAQAR
jgi:solute:Na+ symporter, SSS family